VQHQIQCSIFASQQRIVSNFSWISNAKNTFEVHKLNLLMKNNKQIAFTELGFQENLYQLFRAQKPISRNVWIHILSSEDILSMTIFVILTSIMT